MATITIDLTNNQRLSDDISSDKDGAIYKPDQLMPEKDTQYKFKYERVRHERSYQSRSEHDLDARGDRTISLIISIMIFKI